MSRRNPIFPILWLILLIWIAYPVALFCAGIWIVLQVKKLFVCCFSSVFVICLLKKILCILAPRMISHTLYYSFACRNSRSKLAFISSKRPMHFWKSSSLGLAIVAAQSWTVRQTALLLSKMSTVSFLNNMDVVERK